MKYQIKNISTLKKLLWLDFTLGSTTAIIGLIFYRKLTSILGLTSNLVLIISVITLLYSIVAFILATQKNLSIPLLRTLIYANWFWTIISIGLLFFHFTNATLLGKAFLFLQVIAVGGLAYLEGNQLIKATIKNEKN